MVLMMMMAKVLTRTFIETMFTIIDYQDDDFDYMTIKFGPGQGNNLNLTIRKMLI